MSSKDKRVDIPSIIYDNKTNVNYIRGQFLGKGGFARCFEFTNSQTNAVFAGKVVAKAILTKPQHKSKISEEINIHRTLNHPYVVKFQNYFQDNTNIYILLELCSKRSMMELHKRRRALTVPEVRYFMRQITIACKYLHDNNIIHRDMKLGNLFLSNDMEIKVGDFGLATRLSNPNERKKTLCGTPNYIAPEVIKKSGHSFEVDIWSLGCIMYTLLIGVPPFETSTLRDTYIKIKKNEYSIPKTIDEDARALIQAMLSPIPKNRPKPEEILAHKFLTREPILRRLPTSCLTTEPRLAALSESCFIDIDDHDNRKPLAEANQLNKVEIRTKFAADKENQIGEINSKPVAEVNPTKLVSSNGFLSELIAQLLAVNSREPAKLYSGNNEDAEDPASVPFIWISKWVDYTDRYGIGYELCDNSVGIVFNDNSLLVRFSNKQLMSYTNRQNEEQLFPIDSYPPPLKKKMELFKYFREYMDKNLLKAGENVTPKEDNELEKVPYLRGWLRNETGVIFHLSNGTVQINFFDDHTKLILCPIMGAVSYIDEHKKFTVFKLELIAKYGCPVNLALRLQYAESAAKRLLLRYQQQKMAQKEL